MLTLSDVGMTLLKFETFKRHESVKRRVRARADPFLKSQF